MAVRTREFARVQWVWESFWGSRGFQIRDILNYTILSIGLLGGPGAPRPKDLLLGTPPGGVISKWLSLIHI